MSLRAGDLPDGSEPIVHEDGSITIVLARNPVLVYWTGHPDDFHAALDEVRAAVTLGQRRQVEARMEPLGGDAA